MALPDTAVSYYRDQQQVSISTVLLARRLWQRLGQGDFDAAWAALGPQLLVLLMAGQQAAISQALVYVPAVLDELEVTAPAVAAVSPRSLVGVASDGRDLADLLYQPVIQARTELGQGRLLVDALQSGGKVLDRIVATQVVDTGRAAESLAMVARPKVFGWVRMLQLPSCDRCALLAGKWYGWKAGFQRHPGCDCRHIPAPERLAKDLTLNPEEAIRSGQVRGLSVADTKAIVEDGADPYRVVNAKRGMSTAQVYGRNLKTTTARTPGTAPARRGQRRSTEPRLRPESIYKIADDRSQAVDLLRKYGYFVA